MILSKVEFQIWMLLWRNVAQWFGISNKKQGEHLSCSGHVVPGTWERNQPPWERTTKGVISLGNRVKQEGKRDTRKKQYKFSIYTLSFRDTRGIALKKKKSYCVLKSVKKKLCE